MLAWNRNDHVAAFKLDSVKLRSKESETNYYALLLIPRGKDSVKEEVAGGFICLAVRLDDEQNKTALDGTGHEGHVHVVDPVLFGFGIDVVDGLFVVERVQVLEVELAVCGIAHVLKVRLVREERDPGVASLTSDEDDVAFVEVAYMEIAGVADGAVSTDSCESSGEVKADCGFADRGVSIGG